MKALERHLRAVRRLHVNVFQRVGILLKARIHFQNHVILIQLRENRGDLPLAERVVERVVNRRRQNAQSRGRIAVNYEICLQPMVLLVGGDVAQLRQAI